jgi:hypothetical protein
MFMQRALFWIQSPIALLGGLIVWLSIPASFTTAPASKDKSFTEKLAGIDYPGAALLASAANTKSCSFHG